MPIRRPRFCSPELQNTILPSVEYLDLTRTFTTHQTHNFWEGARSSATQKEMSRLWDVS